MIRRELPEEEREVEHLVMRVGERLIGQVAWRNGYYDYAHMSADFRKICGYAPMTLLRISENDGDEVGWRI